MGVVLLLSFPRPHEHGHFWPFFTIQSQAIEQTTTLHFICNNNLMKERTSITTSIYEIIHFQVFFKTFAQKFSPISRF
jgi:hypothetical protein